MLKVTELMIGDYIMFDGTPYIIEEISSKGWVHIIDIKNKVRVALSTDYILNFIEGIPLTKAILEKNNISEGWGEPFKGYNLMVLTNGYYSIEDHCLIEFKYVHELQNVLKVCGIKKEIEL